MIQLVSMNEDQYEAFMRISERDQMQGHVREGRWSPEEAVTNMAQLKAQFLPQGLHTPNHFFYAIVDEDSGTYAGGLWFVLDEESGARQFFVVDIQIDEAQRRRGYGAQAFLAMEEKAREMDVSAIVLHVFKDNHPARAMYEKLGYSGAGGEMTKAIPRSV